MTTNYDYLLPTINPDDVVLFTATVLPSEKGLFYPSVTVTVNGQHFTMCSPVESLTYQAAYRLAGAAAKSLTKKHRGN